MTAVLLPRWRAWAVAVLSLVFTGTSSVARADRGESRLGLLAATGWGSPQAVLVGAQRGLSDVLFADLRAGGLVRTPGSGGLLEVGAGAVWDVFAWVPSLRVGAQLRSRPAKSTVYAFVAPELRRFFSRRFSVTLGATLLAARHDHQILCSVGLWGEH